VVTAPATLVALAVIVIGLAAWYWRRLLAWLVALLRIPAGFAVDSFGFEWINRQVIGVTQSTANALRVTQTGQLNWNVVGIVGGLVIVLALLALGM
jgi:hypothetical protein